MKIDVIVPLYNEQDNIPLLFEKFLKVRNKIKFDLLLINDCSKDLTSSIIDRLAKKNKFVIAVHNKKNCGWGGSLKIGFEHALKRGADVILCMDGDLTHDPAYIPDFVKAIKEGADLAIGSRFVKGGGMANVPVYRLLLSEISNPFFHAVMPLKTKDLTGGFRAHNRRLLQDMYIESNGFYINLEMTIKAECMGFKVVEIPIIIYPRYKGQSSRKILFEIPKYLKFLIGTRIKLLSGKLRLKK